MPLFWGSSSFLVVLIVLMLVYLFSNVNLISKVSKFNLKMVIQWFW